MKYDIFAKNIETIKQIERHLGINADYDGPVAYFSGIEADKITRLHYLKDSIEIRDERGRIIYPEVRRC